LTTIASWPSPRARDKGETPLTEKRFKLSAYGVSLVDARMLLAHYVSPTGDERHWTLPGGKIDHGEDPYDAVVREVAEETGYDVEVEELLGMGSRVHDVDWGIPGGAELHTMAVYYRVRPIGGELRDEVDGSTDKAAWIPVADIPQLERCVIIDIALKLDRERPPTGHVALIPVTGLLRH
jgi:ADP-ribose pyrophosphatase YjhB (NUDIX family)